MVLVSEAEPQIDLYVTANIRKWNIDLLLIDSKDGFSFWYELQFFNMYLVSWLYNSEIIIYENASVGDKFSKTFPSSPTQHVIHLG